MYFNIKFKRHNFYILNIQKKLISNPILKSSSKISNVFFNSIDKISTISKTQSSVSSNNTFSSEFDSFLLKQENLILQNNWICIPDEPLLTQKNLRDVHYTAKYVIRKKLINRLAIYDKNKTLSSTKAHITFLNNSVKTLKRFLLTNVNNSVLHKKLVNLKATSTLQPFAKPINSKFLLYNTLNPRKQITSKSQTSNLRIFYTKAVRSIKSGYLRSFSKINRNKIFISFKKAKSFLNLVDRSSNNGTFNVSTTNSFFIYNLFSQPYTDNYYSIFSSENIKTTSQLTSKLVIDYNYGISSKISHISEYSINISALLNNYFISSYNYKNNKNNNLLLNNTLPNIDRNHNLSKDNPFNNSLLWSSFYNTLFLSKTKNISANSLFMSASYTDQEHFMIAEIFFADVKFGNFYLNEATSHLNTDKYTTDSLLSLTSKYNSSFFNFLKRRTYTTKPNTYQRVYLLTDSYEHDFKTLQIKNSFDKIFDLKCLSNFLSYFKNKNSYKINYTLSKKNNPSYDNNVYFKLTKCFKRLLSSFKRNTSSSLLSFDDDFQSISKVRQSFITKTLSFFGNKEHSICDTFFKNIEHEESFYPNNFKTNSIIPSNKMTLLSTGDSGMGSTIQFKKLSNLIVLLTNPLDLKLLLKRPNLQKYSNYNINYTNNIINSLFYKIYMRINGEFNNNIVINNLTPSPHFNFSIFKKISGSHSDGIFTMSSVPWHYNTIIRFMEFCSGKKILFQFYPFLFQAVEKYYIVTYKRWMTRMTYYERKLGHKFFLEEALHLIHLTLNLHDPKIMCTWLKAIIQRISFWKTRSIFRFLKYLFSQYFNLIINDLGSKGLKICLRGKISAAGNSRTRTILYRTGQTSHANTSLKVLNEFMTISTFTGVMGFQIWIFY